MIDSYQPAEMPARGSFGRFLLFVKRLTGSARVRRAAHLASMALLVGLIALFVEQERGEWTTLRGTVAHADWRWLGAAVLAELSVMGISVATYRSVLGRVGSQLPLRSVITAYLRNIVVSIVAPVGAAGSVVAMKSLSGYGVPADDAVIVVALVEFIDFVSSLAVMLPTAALLAIDGRLPKVILIAVGVLAVSLSIVGVLFAKLLGGVTPRLAARLLPQRVTLFAERVRAHHLHARDLAPALGLAVMGEIGTITMLAASVRAVGHRSFPLSTPLIGYEVSNATGLVAPVYHGIGAVELALVYALRHEGIPPRAALAGTLLFRIGALWIPLAVGLAWQAGRRVGGIAARH